LISSESTRGAAGDGAAVAATFADDRRDSPVMADSSTVAARSITSASAGMISPARAGHDVTFAEVVGIDFFHLAVLSEAMGDGFDTGAAQGFGLCFAPAFGDGFGEVGEEDGEHQSQMAPVAR